MKSPACEQLRPGPGWGRQGSVRTQELMVPAGPPPFLALPPFSMGLGTLYLLEMTCGPRTPATHAERSTPNAYISPHPARDSVQLLPRVQSTECSPILSRDKDRLRPPEPRAGDGLQSLGGPNAQEHVQ